MYQISPRGMPSHSIETWAVLDTAIERAKKLSKTTFADLIVLDVAERKKNIRAFVTIGVVQWAVPCKDCKGQMGDVGCSLCVGIGMVPDKGSWA